MALIGAAEAAAYQMEEKGRHRNCTQLSWHTILNVDTETGDKNDVAFYDDHES